MTSISEMRALSTNDNSLLEPPKVKRKREKLPVEPSFSSAENSENDIDFAATLLPEEGKSPKEIRIGRSLLRKQVNARINEIEQAKKLFTFLCYPKNKEFKKLLTENPHLVNQTNVRGRTLLAEAIARCNTDVTKFLLKNFPDFKEVLYTTIRDVVNNTFEDLRPLILDLITDEYVEVNTLLPLLVIDEFFLYSLINKNRSSLTIVQEIVTTFKVDCRTFHAICKKTAQKEKPDLYYSDSIKRQLNKLVGFPEEAGIRKRKWTKIFCIN